jgi:hypothetical protein
MQDHVNEFTRLQQEVNYHRDSGSPLTKILKSTLHSYSPSANPGRHFSNQSVLTFIPSLLLSYSLAFDFKNHPTTTSPEVSDPMALAASFKQHQYPKSQHDGRPYDY